MFGRCCQVLTEVQRGTFRIVAVLDRRPSTRCQCVQDDAGMSSKQVDYMRTERAFGSVIIASG